MTGVLKSAAPCWSPDAGSGVLFRGSALIVASTSTDVCPIVASTSTGACPIVAPGWLTAVSASIGARKSIAHDRLAKHASIGAAPDRPIGEHVSIGARRSAATADRMLAAASFRVAHGASHNAVFPCHP